MIRIKPPARRTIHADSRGALPVAGVAVGDPRPLGQPRRERERTRSGRVFGHPGFSLIEVMIAIVILGLGLVMVGTIFPVAWERARKLGEYTVQQSVWPAAEAAVTSLVPVAGPSMNSLGFAGDLVFQTGPPAILVTPSDKRVHALNLENVRVQDRRFVPENPWLLEGMGSLDDLLADPELVPGIDFRQRSYHTARIAFHQRVHPPMDKRRNVDDSGVFTGDDPRWDDALASRRYCWSVLHRLQSYVGPHPWRPPPTGSTNESLAAAAIGSTRAFDMYYVTLRRQQPTNRYALQDPDKTPDPSTLNRTPNVTPAALPGTDDVMFPVPWRVQVQYPASLESSANAAGIPTEIEVPPPGFSSDESARLMLIQMFPVRARFIDEITGSVYQVTHQRLALGSEGDTAFLTLDREVVLEDIDLEEEDPRCGSCQPLNKDDPVADAEELLRTVWVFPPSAEPRTGSTMPTFKGAQPVVSIDVRTVNITPTG